MKAQVKKSGRTTYGNKQLKAVIIEVAWAATHTKNSFTLSSFGSPQGQEKSFDSSRALNPEIAMAYA